MGRISTMGCAMRLSAVSLFAGCGGSDLGLRAAGIETIWANEVDEDACALYEANMGAGIVHCDDVRNIRRFPRADILAGCYPCQGYSQGGRRNQKDTINYLYQEFDRALRQIRPLAFIAENVDGMRFSQNASLMRSQLVRFRMAGYRVATRVIDAKDYGLAQDRRRIFLVGIRSSDGVLFRFPPPTHGPGRTLPYRTLHDVIWHLRKAPDGSFDSEPFHWYYLSRNRRRTWGQQSPCIVAHWRHVGLHPSSPPLTKTGKDRWVFKHKGPARRYSYFECAALQGFRKLSAFGNATSIPVRRRFRAIGNAVPPPVFAAVAKALVQQLKHRP
jgi:DNA (cytosine-5)-methyltransferase 1